MVERNLAHTVYLSDVVRIILITSETDSRAGHYKNKQYKVPQIHYTHLSWIQGSIEHQPFTDSITDTKAVHRAALQAGLSGDCGLSYQPPGLTVTPK